MKKFILTSILSLSTVFVLSAQVSPSVCVDIQNELSYKNRVSQLEDQILKSEVITLQNFLATTRSPITKRPYISQTAFLRITQGDFDEVTAAAVRYFQFEKRLVKSRTIKSSAVILGNATRAKIAEVSGCPVATVSVPTTVSKTVVPKVASLTLMPGAMADVVETPTLTLEYDSSNSEAVLVGRASVMVSAGDEDVYLYRSGVANAILFVSSTGAGVDVSSLEASETLLSGNASLVVGPTSGLTFYKIPANQKATFALVVKKNPKHMFAGAYTISVRQMDAFRSTNALQEDYSPIQVSSNTSRQVTIVGEVSPYISSATIDATALVRVTGARFDLPGNLYMIDGTTSITNSKGDANTISFNINDYGLSAGYHTLQILNPRVGNSNSVSFEVTSSFTGTASAYVMSSPAPTLTLKYDYQNKEASLVYEAYVNVTATGGDVKINSAGVYSNDGYTFNILNTNALNQSAVSSTSPIATFAAGLTKGNGLIIPSGNRATYKVTNIYNVKQSFAGNYKASIQLYDPTYTRNLLGSNTSNAVTIIGETSPYITTAVIDGSNNVVLTGTRFHPTGNTIISGSQRLNLPSTEGGTKIIFPLRSLGITNTSGYFNVQVSHPTEGLSNSYYVQFDQSSVTNPVTNPATEVTPTGAVLNMFFNTLGNAYSTYFYWGTNAKSLTNLVRTTNTKDNTYSAPVLGLSPNTNYYFVANAKNDTTGESLSGNVLNFMTLGGATAPAPTLTFTGNNSAGTMAVTSGQPVYLKWSSTNALLCNATGSWSGMKATSSTEVVYPQQTTTYILSCGGVGGETNQVTKSVTVNVCPNGQTWNGTVCAGATIPVGTTPTASAYFVSTPTLTLLKDGTGNPTSLKAEYVVNVYAPTSNVTVTGFPVTPGLYGFTGTIKNTATQQIISNSGTTTVTWGAGVTTGPTNTNTITVPVGNRATFVVTQYFDTYTLPSGSYVGSITLKSYEGNNIAPNTPTNVVSMGAITPVSATVSFSASNGAVSVNSPLALEVIPTQRVTLTWSSTGMSSCTPSGTDANNPTNAGYWTGTQLNVSGTKTFASPWFTAVVPNPAPVTYTITCTPVLGGTPITKSIEVKKAIVAQIEKPIAMCDYTPAPTGCTYINGSSYNATTGCGKVLECTVTKTAEPVKQAVTVSNVPGAPTGLSLIGGNKRVTATFTPPTNTGGSAISLYVLDCGTGTTYGSLTSPILYVDQSFINGKSYSCSVYAINANGAGARATANVTLPLPLASILTPYSSVITGGKNTYAPGETMSFSIKGTAIDGTPATSAKGFGVTIKLVDNTGNTISINGVSQAKNATYDTVTGAWLATFTAPVTAGVQYRVVSTLTCLNSSLGCSNATPNPSMTEQILNFSVVNPVIVANRAVDITFSNVKATSMDLIATLNVGITGSTAFIVYASGAGQTLSPDNCVTSAGCFQTASITPTADATNKQYTFSLTGLTPNTTYRYKVYVRDPQGNLVEGSWSLQNVITPTGISADCINADANGDGKMTMADLEQVKNLSGSQTGDGRYVASADIDKSGIINSGDILRVRGMLMKCYIGPIYAYSVSTLTSGQTTHTAGSIITVGVSALTSNGNAASSTGGFSVDVEMNLPDGSLVMVNGVAQTVFTTYSNGTWSANLSIPEAGPTIYTIRANIRCADTSKGCSLTDEGGAMVPVRSSSNYKFTSVQ